MQSFWSSLQRELLHRRRFQTRAEAQAAIFEWPEIIYNRERFHGALDYQSALDFELNLN
jgi:transposase InsO family protein